MAKFGRIFWNNNNFINVFYNFEIYQNPILITEIQLYYQVYHDLCKCRHTHCQIVYKQIHVICPSLEEFFGIITILLTFL